MPARPRPWTLLAALVLLLAPRGSLAGSLKAPAPAYPAVPAGWAGALPAALPPPLAGLDLKDSAQRQALAPVARALDADLGLSPERYRALPGPERAAALELAVSQARSDLEARVARLAAEARAAPRSASPGGREERLRAYGTAFGLHEIRSRYAGYLSPSAREQLDDAWARASARAYEMSRALLGEAREDPAFPPAAAAKATGGARKALESMRASRAGWTLDDLRGLLLGHGFEEKAGAKHVIFVHPDFPELRKSVSRSSGPLAKGYSTAAIRLIDRLAELRAAASPPSSRRAPRPPAEVSLEDLAILLSPP